MKGFGTLFQRDFSNCLPVAWGLAAAAAVLQPLLYWLPLQNLREATRFETAYLASAAPVLLPVLFAGLLGWMVWMAMRERTNGSIAALLTLPGGRARVYWAKIAAFSAALFLLMAGVLAGIGLCYPFFLHWCEEFVRVGGADCRMTAGFWLGLVREPLFRLLCPMTLPEVLSTLLLLGTLPVLGVSIGWRGGRVRAIVLVILAGCCWVNLLRFRLMENRLFPEWLPPAVSAALLLLLVLMAWDCIHAVRTGDF